MILARVLSATPLSDGEHWDLKCRMHIDECHTDAYQQDPAPFQRNPQLTGRAGPPYPWRPGKAVWSEFDALFPSLTGFNVYLDTTTSPTSVQIAGNLPVNVSPAGFAPQIPFEGATANTGGSIPPGTYLVALGASAAGPVTPRFVHVVVPAGTSTNTIIVSGAVWQAAASQPTPFVGMSSMLMYAAPAWTGSVPDAFGNNTTFTITSLAPSMPYPGTGTQYPDAPGLPDPIFNSLLFQGKDIIHGGVWGAAATSKTIDLVHNTISLTFAGAAWSVNQWRNYVVSSYADDNPVRGFDADQNRNSIVVSNTANTLVFSIAGSNGDGPQVGEVVVMRAAAKSITATTIGDPNFVNSYAALGLSAGAEVGNLIRIIAGTGAGQPPILIQSNTTTVFTLASPWLVTPDSTSVYIIEAAAWRYFLPTGSLVNDGTGAGAFISAWLPITNLLGGSILIEGITLDSAGNWSIERYAPLRELYVPAQPAGGPATDYIVPITIVGGVATATPDASQGANLLVLTAAICSTDSNGNKYVNVAAPINYSTAIGVYTPWQLIVQQDPATPSGGYSTVFDPVGGSYRIGFAVASLQSQPNTQCHVDFKTSSTGVTTPTGSLLDQPI